jgi:phage-related protein
MTKKYKIEFWQEENGYSETQSYIWELKQKSIKSKDARIKLNKIVEYMSLLESYGTEIGYPYIDHIECEEQIFELRPLRDRFFFFYKQDSKYIILNHFMKKTQKTPRREIEKAIKLMKDYNERNL